MDEVIAKLKEANKLTGNPFGHIILLDDGSGSYKDDLGRTIAMINPHSGITVLSMLDNIIKQEKEKNG